MNGKGSSRRPTVVTEAEAVDRWAATFGKPKPPTFGLTAMQHFFGEQLAETDSAPDTARHEKHSREECG